MRLTGKIDRMSVDCLTGKVSLTLELNERTLAQTMFDELHEAPKLSLEVKKWRASRSRNANNYMWELCTEIADRLSEDGTPVTKDEIYRKAIYAVGVFKDFEYLPQSEASTLETAWGMLGTGWVTERVDWAPDGERVTVRCYYGSSRYSTKQMKRLIDFVIDECRNLGIPTETPEELSRLCERWGEEQGEKCHTA